jgi:hypothetical protein
VGTAEVLIAPQTGPGEVQGTVAVDVGPGPTLFRLKPAIAANSIIAQVTVTGLERRAGILASVEDALSTQTSITVQAIIRVSVTPQAHHAEFVFRTLIPTIPTLIWLTVVKRKNSAYPTVVSSGSLS